jgi:hypothetical protein
MTYFRLAMAGHLALLLTQFAPALMASDTAFQPVPTSELSLKSEPLAPDAPAIILFREVNRDDTQGSKQYEHVRIKILTEEGRKYGNIEIPYSKDFGQEIKDIRARTVRPDGSTIDFSGQITDQTIIKTKKFKYQAKVVALPDVQIGSIVEYAYEKQYRDDRIHDSSWVVDDDLFTKHAEFSMKPNKVLALRCAWWLPPGIEGPKQGSDHIYRLQMNNVAAFKTEEFMPPETQMKSHVEFIYSRLPFEDYSENFWRKIGAAEYDYQQKFCNKRDVIQQALSGIVAPTDPSETKLRKIYARVQQLQNTSYEEDKTAQEQKREKRSDDHNVGDVWKRGYGDEWQISVLFLSLAQAAGFDASLVLAPSRRLYFFDPKQMDWYKLDSVLIVVNEGGKQRFFEPGSPLAPFGMLPWQDTGISGFRVEKDGGTWIQIPMDQSSASRIERVAKLKLTETGDLEGTVTITFTGHEGWLRRWEKRKDDQAARKKYLEDEVGSFVPAGIEVELTNQPAWTAATEPLVAEYRVKIPGWASSTGRRVLLPVGVFSSEEKHTFEHADRVHPIYNDFLSQRIDDVTIELPNGWTASNLPEFKPPQGGNIISFTTTVENNKTSLHITRKLDVSFLMLATKYYASLQKFFQQVRTADEEQIVLQSAATTASK